MVRDRSVPEAPLGNAERPSAGPPSPEPGRRWPLIPVQGSRAHNPRRSSRLLGSSLRGRWINGLDRRFEGGEAHSEFKCAS